MAEHATIGLSTYRWNNNLKSIALLAAFPLLLLLLVGVIFFAFGWLAAGGAPGSDAFGMFGLTPVLGSLTPWDLALSAVVAWWPLVLGVAAIWVLIGYLFNGAIIRAATGAKAVARTEQPELYNLLENLCISRGLAMPKLFLIDSEVLNAYASGIGDKTYAITVTRGLLERLDRDELEAVLAHELTHIVNRDVRLLIVTIVFTGMISFLAQMLWRSLRFARFRSGGGKKGAGGVVILMLIAAVAFAIGTLLALALRFALSRRREYLADAGSVELTKNPDALIAALTKISGHAHLPDVPAEVRQMFIENPPARSMFAGLFATHPPMESRIRVLEQLGGRAPPPSVPQVDSSDGAPSATGFGKRRSPWG